MAITRDEFKPVPSSGIIPDDRVPASQFAVGYTFTYTGSPSLGTFNHSFTGTIRLQVLRADDSIKYSIEIQQTYNLFIFPLAPGLVMYTWNWSPNSEQIIGRLGPDPHDEDAPLMTTLGQGTFGVDPADGFGTSDREVIVNSTFYSGIFTEPLERGDKIKIVFHNLSAGFVVARASLSLATESKPKMLDAQPGHFGEIVMARGMSNAVQGGHTFTPHRFPTQRGFVSGARNPTLIILPDGREILGVLELGGFFEYESYDTQRSWKRIEYPNGVQPLLPANVTMPSLIRIENTRIAMAVEGSKLVARRVDGDGVSDLVEIGPVTGNGDYTLAKDDSGKAWVYNETGQAVYYSENTGMSWHPVEAEVA